VRATAVSVFALILGVAGAVAAATEPPAEGSRDLADLSIEELMNESITSVSKKEQRIGEAPAAVYVLTGEEILRAGHTSIPEALRMVPGLSVARLDSHTWVITARGFAGESVGKLLVLIDGRSVFDPFFSGVSWELQDVPLEDLDRIEVIRGPGATLWGSNAVNGVINIITKQASDTQGGLVVGGGGPQERSGTIRYGGHAGNAQYRTYFKYDEAGDSILADGTSAQDAWHMWRAGLRTDWQAAAANTITLQGDLYDGREGSVDTLASFTPPYSRVLVRADRLSGGNVLGRWTHESGAHSHWSLQLNVDHAEAPSPVFGVNRNIFNLEFQQQLDLGSRQTFVYGAGGRMTQSKYSNSFTQINSATDDSDLLFNVFLQDDIALVNDRLALSLGTKVERDEYSGSALQPNARLLWTPNNSNSVWASVARAVRAPNPLETETRINEAVLPGQGSAPTLPTLISVLPNPNLASERLVAYEAGYRLQPDKSIYLDIAAFVNVYDGLIVTEDYAAFLETTPPPAHLTVATQYNNDSKRETHGIEFASSWQVTDWWKLAAGYTWLQMDLGSQRAAQIEQEQPGDSPRDQWNLRSSIQWSRSVSFDTALYYVDPLPAQGIPSYVRLDMHVGWRASDSLSASLTGTNLLQGQHAEFAGYGTISPVEVRRSLYARLTWSF
jgi:iron complex outermembrane receptor protein